MPSHCDSLYFVLGHYRGCLYFSFLLKITFDPCICDVAMCIIHLFMCSQCSEHMEQSCSCHPSVQATKFALLSAQHDPFFLVSGRDLVPTHLHAFRRSTLLSSGLGVHIRIHLHTLLRVLHTQLRMQLRVLHNRLRMRLHVLHIRLRILHGGGGS